MAVEIIGKERAAGTGEARPDGAAACATAWRRGRGGARLPGMTAIAQRYRGRADAFQRRIEGTGDGQWHRPSPCEGWSALDVVGHVVDMHEAMLRPLGRRLGPAPAAADDPLAAFLAARADVEAVLADPALAAAPCDTPAGTVSAERHIDEVLSDDIVLHCWDLAKATGQDADLDPGDAAALWARVNAVPAETMERLRTPGAFGAGVEVYGPEVGVPGEASLQDRLLGALGRDPDWSPGHGG
ncbi:TIGR03086 family metal-binding protein [Nocardiopsis sp. CNT-189]|uniref:TIGR03086 family metal-binding protein n=1 Tax=Nocardiopsis oceanisediminis TaxID=2816862 RepID=UPI003B3B5E22